MTPAKIGASNGHHVHALIFGLINRSSPTLAQHLHSVDGVRPFTVSPLLGRFEFATEASKSLALGESYGIRVTALQEQVFVAILDGAIKQVSQPVQLGEATFKLVQVQDVPGTAPLVACQTFEQLLDEASPRRTIHLEFMTPTTFRTKEQRNVLQPDPRLVVQSWLTRWNVFSPSPLDTSLLDRASELQPSYVNVQTRSVHMGNHPELGFYGFTGFRLSEDISSDNSRYLAALANFSLYCGTGAKTSMGMGQTRQEMTNGSPVLNRARGNPTEGRRYLTGD